MCSKTPVSSAYYGQLSLIWQFVVVSEGHCYLFSSWKINSEDARVPIFPVEVTFLTGSQISVVYLTGFFRKFPFLSLKEVSAPHGLIGKTRCSFSSLTPPPSSSGIDLEFLNISSLFYRGQKWMIIRVVNVTVQWADINCLNCSKVNKSHLRSAPNPQWSRHILLCLVSVSSNLPCNYQYVERGDFEHSGLELKFWKQRR